MPKTIPHLTPFTHSETTEKWEQAFDALTDHVMILDQGGNIVWANLAIRDQVEAHLGPIVGKHYRLPYYGEHLPLSPPPWDTVLAGALSAIVETSLPALPGYFLVSCYPLFDTQGTQWGAISVVKDITDRKRIEEALRKIAQSDPTPGSIAFLRSLVKDLCKAVNVPYAILADLENAADPNAHTVAIWAQGTFVENISWAPPITLFDELIREKGCAWNTISSPIFPPTSVPAAWPVTSYMGCALRGQAGHIIGILMVLSPQPILNPHVAQTIVQLFGARAANELQRKKTEDALRDSEQRYRAIVENAYDLIIEISNEGECHYISPNCQAVLGYEAADLIGKSFFDFVYPEERQALAAAFHSNIGALQEIDITCRLQTKRGEWRWCESHVHPFRTSMGTVKGVIVTRDITEHKRVEEERLRATKLESVGLLAGGIAHDFNNILTSVFANIGLAKLLTAKNPGSNTTVVERLSAAGKACLRARDLTKQLLTFAKGGAPVKSTTSISSIIRDTVEFVLRGSSVRCHLNLPENIWPVVVDEGQISQVLQNLIINAEQAMPEGGAIEVNVANESITAPADLPLKEGNYVRVSVQDQGIGIPHDHLSKIFDPYFTTKQKGSGLGLATTYSIIKRHEGHITVSSALGKGACFTVYLSASAVQEQYNEEGSHQLICGKGRVLIMDDEDEIQEVLGKMLEHLGFEVDYAKDGETALRIFSTALRDGRPYAVTILDLTIPGGMGGKETLRQMKAIHPEAAVIVSSGYSNDPVLARFQDFGFSGVIAKPYNLVDLSKVLTQIL